MKYALMYEEQPLGEYTTVSEAESVRRERIDNAPDHVRDHLTMCLRVEEVVPPKPEEQPPPPNSYWEPSIQKWVLHPTAISYDPTVPAPTPPSAGPTPTENSGLIDLGGGMWVHKDELKKNADSQKKKR